ncbi:hypothetical protein [Puia sp.]|jgi:hypothetical protein|uniref:hypothetical protein n=1 Tax=Puia sp. TaxID=2045100 RepID=UPI002F3E71D3
MIKYRRYSLSELTGAGLYIVPFLCFVLLVALSFFTYPSAEDLAVHYNDHLLGVGSYIRLFYQESSRYVSFPLIFFLLDGSFLMEHYFLAALVLLVMWYGVMVLLVRTVTGLLLPEQTGMRRVAWLAMTLLVSGVAVLFQPASVLYWVSGSMIYLLSFLLFLLLLTVLLRVAARGRATGGEWVWALAAAVLVAGTNEITLFFTGIILVWAQLVYREVTGRFLWPAAGMLAVLVVCVVVAVLPGGAANRAGHFGLHFSVGNGVGVAVLYTGRIYYRMITSPLLWLCLVLAGTAGSITRTDIRKRLAGSKWFHPLVCLAPAVPGVAAFYFLIYVFSGELLAPRANGTLELFVLLFLLAACYSWGTRVGETEVLRLVVRREPLVLAFGLLLFIGSGLLSQGVGDLGAGIIYRGILEQRKADIQAAKNRGEHRVVLRSYSTDYSEAVKRRAPGFVQKSLIRRGAAYPRLSFYQDPLADTGLYIHYYAEYYGIDTIDYEGHAYGRVGLIQRQYHP